MPFGQMQTLWPALPPASSSLWLTSTLTTAPFKSSSTPVVSPQNLPCSIEHFQTEASISHMHLIQYMDCYQVSGGGLTASCSWYEYLIRSSVIHVWQAGRADLFEWKRLSSFNVVFRFVMLLCPTERGGWFSPRGRIEPWSHWSRWLLMKDLNTDWPAARGGQFNSTQTIALFQAQHGRRAWAVR